MHCVLAALVAVSAATCAERQTIAARLDADADPRQVAARRGVEYVGPVGELGHVHLFATICGSHDDHLIDPREHHTRRARGVVTHPQVQWAEVQTPRLRHTRASPVDPLYEEQWHLHPTATSQHVHSNAEAAWAAGHTGSGVQIAIVDDGLEYTHPDLAPRYAARSSHDYNDGQAQPTPTRYDTHGTSAAGVAAAARDGAVCGVGVAYDAALAGVRLIARAVTDAQEAMGLTHRMQENDIYSCSWGPSDDGRTLDGPGALASQSMLDAVRRGRDGRGSIYVWAAGNGARRGDSCAHDGYAGSRLTIAVGAVTHLGRRADYSERCAALFISAPSSGDGEAILTTDLAGARGRSVGDCRADFGGTSAAAPVVAGVVALALEANPRLTWRDVQHVLAESAAPVDRYAPSWTRNAAGVWHSDEYGFGMVDAARAAELAATWEPVPVEALLDSGERRVAGGLIPEDGTWLEMTATATRDLVTEWVEVTVDVSHRRRGDIELTLRSPGGTTVLLVPPRPYDGSDDYDWWTASSCATWGERSKGAWTLRATDRVRGTVGTLARWRITVYGYQ